MSRVHETTIREQPVPADAAAGPGARTSDRLLWLILATSALVKLVLAFMVDGHRPVLDEVAYMSLAETLASEGRYVGTFRPPLYPGFLAVFLATGLGTLGVRVAQALISTASAWLVYRIAGHVLDRRGARIAAALFAFNPVLIAFAHRLWSETLFILLMLVALDLLVVGARARSRLPWLAAGAVLGVAGLARPLILTFAPLLLPWALLEMHRWRREGAAFARPWREATLRFALLGVACSAVVLPWTARNLVTTGAPILVDTNGPFNFLVGSQREAAFVDKDDLWSERFGRVDGRRYEEYVLEDPGRAQDLALAQARANVREDPGLFVRKSLWEAGHLWTLDSFLLRHVRNGWYGGTLPRPAVALITAIAAGFSAALVLLGLAGLAALHASPLRGLGLLLIVHSTVLFGLTYSLSRYALPLHAILTFGAAAALADPRAVLDGLRRPPRARLRTAALLAALVLIASAWVRDMPLLTDMVLHGGTSHQFHMERIDPATAMSATAGSLPGDRP